MVDVLRRAEELGFIGSADVEAEVAHSLEFAACFAELRRRETTPTPRPSPDDSRPGSFLDLGSGGGLPGLVLAGAWSDSSGVLLEANQRRARFLEEALSRLDLGERVQVVLARAEVAGREPQLRGHFDLVVARSFGTPAVTAECGGPFVRTSGALIVSEPPEPQSGGDGAEMDPPKHEGGLDSPNARWAASNPRRWPADSVAELGLELVGSWHGRFSYQVLRRCTPCPSRYPRREGVAAKRPLWRVSSGQPAVQVPRGTTED